MAKAKARKNAPNTKEKDIQEFFEALALMGQEKGIPLEYLVEKITEAIKLAVKKDPAGSEQNIVEINPETKRFYVAMQKEVVENLRRNSEVRSPISGVVTARNFEPGDLFGGQPILHIMQIDKLKVMANISEQYFADVKVGMPVQVSVDIYPGETFEGRVSLIYPALDTATRTFKVEVTLPNTQNKLRPGMYARATFDMGTKDGIMVPDISILKQSGSNERYVYVIEGDKATRRSVRTGRQVEDRIDILSGVSVGEKVATTALTKLSDGAKIELAGSADNR